MLFHVCKIILMSLVHHKGGILILSCFFPGNSGNYRNKQRKNYGCHHFLAYPLDDESVHHLYINSADYDILEHVQWTISGLCIRSITSQNVILA